MIRRLPLAVLAVLLLLPVLAAAQVFVPGYLRHDGTYVQPHYRSYPDGNPYNNYRRPRGLDPSIPLAGRQPHFTLPNWGDVIRQRQEIELRQLAIEDYRRRLQPGR